MQYIRADANETIGTGHIMRCLSIAEELRDRGEDVTFIISDTCFQNMIWESGFKTLCLYSLWNDFDQEIDTMIQIIRNNQISLLLIDSYFVTELYLKEIGHYTKIAYIDDVNRFIYPVNLLINYNIYAESLQYQLRYLKAGINTRFALGCQYAPIRKEFFSIKKEFPEKITSILITSGGTDNYNVIDQLLQAIYKQVWFEGFDYYVIVGKFNRNREKLKDNWKRYKNIHLFVDVRNISDYIKKCDIAITAGGVTTYELCACGTPAIMYTLADNQLDIARSVSEQKLIPWVGDVRQDMQGCIRKILGLIEKFSENITHLHQISKRMKQVVDGKGCKRLANCLLEI